MTPPDQYRLNELSDKIELIADRLEALSDQIRINGGHVCALQSAIATLKDVAKTNRRALEYYEARNAHCGKPSDKTEEIF